VLLEISAKRIATVALFWGICTSTGKKKMVRMASGFRSEIGKGRAGVNGKKCFHPSSGCCIRIKTRMVSAESLTDNLI
jgi:hypothetical protein